MQTLPLQLKHPIVLIHGLGAQSSYGPIEYFYGLPALLKNDRNQVLVVNLAAWNTIDHRASQLKEQIEKAFPDKKVNLVGHSMGGLDARFLTSRLSFEDRIASVTTIGTPHHGSSMGDISLELLPPTAFAVADQFLKFMNYNTGAFKQITKHYCRGEFAEIAPNVEKVAYFSATTAISNPVYLNSLPIFWLPHRILSRIEGDNDGFVSVHSAQWGEHICTYAGDHYSQIGQFLGRARGMDYMGFYHEIFSHLKKRGM